MTLTIRPLLLVLILMIAGAASAAEDVRSALGQARNQCRAGSPPLRPNAQLDEVARSLSQGSNLQDALRASGYRARRSFQWTMRGYRTPQAMAQNLVQSHCKNLGDPEFREVGVHASGNSSWIVVAAPFSPPAQAQATDIGARVLALANQARAQPRRCGSQSFGAAPPLVLNTSLNAAAAEHANSMARRSFLEHEGRDGSSPADRASRAGYRWRSIAENIAAGQTTPERVMADWLKSPEHCVNIMDPRFNEMGVAFAVNKTSQGGIYWAQLFGRR
ncbi:MAG: hypothetical protein AVDCRST_MAG51-2558 [uncultured Ramlibacter sp.]|uniref:SCP domain-containing protein n=1 Tax=uncultured Ramlibacter sp. TaxID=260755 RepID=A0A6J4PZJ0_9BURK|nr:MAG: hypothetical protein AVDCRST_MAG51-2558 [uncultured Ramlibacter sp.]